MVLEPTFNWDVLLSYIRQQKVVPIVGPELLEIECEYGSLTLDQYLARQLTTTLCNSMPTCPPNARLSDVAWQFLSHNPGATTIIEEQICQILAQTKFPPAQPLRQLAEITDFTLFVSTTPDLMLQAALDEVRFLGKMGTCSHAFSLHERLDDIPAEDAKHPRNTAIVYQLFGSVRNMSDFVVTEEDALEFLHDLQLKRPSNLFDRLRRSCLLLLGCNFPDWLTRFFLRLLSEKRMIESRSRRYIADQCVPNEPRLVMFLRNTSVDIFHGGCAVAFIEELHERWRHRIEEERAANNRPIGMSSPAMTPSNSVGTVFLSYASEDRARVLPLKEALEHNNIHVWFDQRSLEPGDPFEEVIMRNIESSALFFPCISACSLDAIHQLDEDRFIRDEWEHALRVAGGRGDRFIWPILLDDTPQDSKHIPKFLRRLHMQSCPGGLVSEEFITLVKRRLTEIAREEHVTL